ncbi:hypothetical protein F2P79_005459 [Pimephales promelas]|nr:hypothetical protein F2P79_005459 [Pimephales promelas]
MLSQKFEATQHNRDVWFRKITSAATRRIRHEMAVFPNEFLSNDPGEFYSEAHDGLRLRALAQAAHQSVPMGPVHKKAPESFTTEQTAFCLQPCCHPQV